MSSGGWHKCETCSCPFCSLYCCRCYCVDDGGRKPESDTGVWLLLDSGGGRKCAVCEKLGGGETLMMGVMAENWMCDQPGGGGGSAGGDEN